MFNIKKVLHTSVFSAVSFDDLASMVKQYEARYESTCVPGLPILLRLDGSGFHKFTKGLDKPYDVKLSTVMRQTMQYLTTYFQAHVGYTQSDEITLIIKNELTDNLESGIIFKGRVQKLCSLVAARCTAKFNELLAEHLPHKCKELPVFDCRVFQLPSLELAAKGVLWRELDCTKNAVSMAAHTYFSHKSLQKQSCKVMIDRLMTEKQINFNEYPDAFKRGTFCIKKKVLKSFTDKELETIPEQYRPTEPVLRTEYIFQSLPKMSTIVNLTEFLFDETVTEVQVQSL